MDSSKNLAFNNEKPKPCTTKVAYIPPYLTILYDIEKMTHGGDPQIPLESQGTFS